MSKNSFEELAQENEKKFSSSYETVKENIKSRKDLWSFVAGLIELYVPKLFQTLLGGSSVSHSTGITDSDKE